MSLRKLISQFEREFMTDSMKNSSTNHWTNFKAAYKRNPKQNDGLHALRLTVLHERNGSRGNGLGMGHQNKPNRIK